MDATETYPTGSLGAGLVDYLRANGFAPDGGASDRWALVRLGPVPIAYPNLDARKRAVRYHDLHHVVTGYPTDLQGEIAISAWEVGSGCKRYWFAWVIGLSALMTTIRWPGSTIRAFARGRRCTNLYGAPYPDQLNRSVAEVRTELGLDADVRVGPGDVLRFLTILPLAWISSALVATTSVLTAPWWTRAGVHRRRRAPGEEGVASHSADWP